MAMTVAPPHCEALPHDLIVEILSWVPVKDLLRFRCVSKAWNSLISHPTFVKSHLQRSSSQNPHILLTFHRLLNPEVDQRLFGGFVAQCSLHDLLQNPSSTVGASFHIHDDNFYVFGACNGLVCVMGYFNVDEFEEFWVQFWNPALRIMSEDSSRLRIHSSDYILGEYYLKFGFGYDDRNDTYKVVVILFDVKLQQREIRVHCLGDTCWRKVLNCPAFPILAQVNGQFVSDTLNWLALRRSSSDYEWETVTANELVIFSYDIKNETYRYLSMPDDLSEVPCVEPELGVLKGCLVCVSHRHRETHFVVWLMRELGVENSWTQLLNVSYEHLRVRGLCRCPVNLLCMSEKDDVLLLGDDEGDKFVFYNLRDNIIDRTEGFTNSTCLFSSNTYVQSLILPY